MTALQIFILALVGGAAFGVGQGIYATLRRVVGRWLRSRDTVWVVGKVVDGTDRVTSWELIGVFRHREEAIELCAGPDFFVGPAVIDVPQPTYAQAWPGIQFPKSGIREVASR